MIQGNIEEMLEKEGLFIATTVGMSMYPLFKNRRDNVVIKPRTGKLKKYDVPLYKRGDKYILHRIIDIKDGYIIRGDNCDNVETDITDENIIGILSAFWRNDRFYTVNNPIYKVYSYLTVFLHPLRLFYKRCLNLMIRAKRKLFPKK